MSTWRDIARPIIASVIEQVGLDDERRLKKALKEAYPFGEREYFPYKVCLDEIKVQRGLKVYGKKPKPKDTKQINLWE